MQIISHRGYWIDPAEKNSLSAFRRSFDFGFGTETDVRDFKGDLVISHDVPNGTEIKFIEVLELLSGRDLPIAINIKSDGLGEKIRSLLAEYRLLNWFTFDMSAPELIRQNRSGIQTYTRLSDFESIAVCYSDCTGVWVDGFDVDWSDANRLNAIMEDGKNICVVSPELHGRDPRKFWKFLKDFMNFESPRLMLCTDLPMEARSYFERVS